MNIDETLSLWSKGKEEWNGWVEGMLAEQAALRDAETWQVNGFGEGENEETRAWLDRARADFSGQSFAGDTDFSGFLFPGPALFAGANFSGDADFAAAQFLGAADFTAACFASAVHFGEANFADMADFTETVFVGPGDFERARFALESNGLLAASARFGRAHFHDKAEFRGAHFAGKGEFCRLRVEGNARFDEASFSAEAAFQGAMFEGLAGFNKATFSGIAEFDGAHFGADARFGEASFKDLAKFNQASFMSTCSFRAAHFGADAGFDQAHFGGEARFLEVHFAGASGFAAARFDGAAQFDDTRFIGPGTFQGTHFCDESGFRRAVFSASARFTESHFAGPAFFSNARFEDEAAFQSISSQIAFILSDAHFAIVPSFHEAAFQQPPRFDYLHIAEPLKRFRHRSYWRDHSSRDPRPWVLRLMRVARDKHVTARYRRLKQICHDAQDYEREQEFFAQEMRAARFWHDRPFGHGKTRFWLGWLYGGVSDFGRSILRPFLLWLGVVVVSTLFYLGQRERAALSDSVSAAFPSWPAHPDVMKIVDWARDIAAWLFDAIVSLYTSSGCVHGDSGATAESFYLAFKNAFFFLQWESEQAAQRVYGCLYGIGASGHPTVPLSVSVGAAVENLTAGMLLFLFLLGLRNLLKVQ